MLAHAFAWSKTIKNTWKLVKKVPFSSFAWEAHEEKWKKKFVCQRLGVTPKSWLTNKLFFSFFFVSLSCGWCKRYFFTHFRACVRWSKYTTSNGSVIQRAVIQMSLFFQSKFLSFYAYSKSFNSDTFHYDSLDQTDYVFMRWKEHFLVSSFLSSFLCLCIIFFVSLYYLFKYCHRMNFTSFSNISYCINCE